MKHADLLITGAVGVVVLGGAALGVLEQANGRHPEVGGTLTFHGGRPADAALAALLLLGPLFPLAVAWGALPFRRYRLARMTAGAALLLASAQGAWALLLLLDPSTGWGAPSLLPYAWELRGLLNNPPEWIFFLGAGSVWAAATWLTIHGIDSRRAAPPPAVAGSRVRAKAPTASGAAPAPRE